MKAASPTRTYHQVARADASERTREALLDAAEAVFLDGRWGVTALEAIAVKAGVTKPTLLRHFGSKAGLREQAIARAMGRVREQRWTAPTDDIAGAVAILLDHYEAVGERAMLIGRDNGPDTDVGASARQMHYDWVDHAFGARLARLAAPGRHRRRAALITVCDVQTWWILSHELCLPKAEVQATLTDALERLLEETP